MTGCTFSGRHVVVSTTPGSREHPPWRPCYTTAGGVPRMTRVALITDSAACLPPRLAEEHGIQVVPLTLVLARSESPGLQVKVIGSGAAAMAQGFMVLEAARAAAEGGDLEVAAARVEAL